MELNLFSNFAPFFIALAILVVLKFKLWRNVEAVNWPQRICGLLLGPVAVFSMFLLYILLGNVDASSMGISIFILMLYLCITAPIFAVIVVFAKAKSFVMIAAIALGTNLLYLVGQFLMSDNPNRAANLLDFEILSVLAINALIFAGTYWAYIKNWPRLEIPSKIEGNE